MNEEDGAASRTFGLKEGEGHARWWSGGLATIKATGKETGGRYTLVEVLEPEGEEAGMGVEDSGLTLQGLAHRLEALERENVELRDEVSALRGSGTHRDKLAEMRGPDTRLDGEPVSELDGRVSRSALLSKAGAAAVAAVAAGTLFNPREAKAHHFFTSPDHDVITANEVYAHYVDAEIENNATPGVKGKNTGSAPGVLGENSGSGPGVKGRADDSGVEGIATSASGAGVEGIANGNLAYGVRGTGFFGVWGESDRAGGWGVSGRNTNTDCTGVKGITNNTDGRAGVRGEGSVGVWGVSSNDQQAGVRGDGSIGVWGLSSKTSYSGVYGEHTGTSGHGTVGIGKGGAAGVLERNSSGIGVQGQGRYGGTFEGSRAQLMLQPKSTAGRPTSGAHTKGEIYMDSAGALFVCVTGGTPGTWRKVTTTTA
jgi:hypothetical protein